LHSHSETIELNPTSWEKMVQKDPHVWAIKFHSGMCGTCQAFAPDWEAASEKVDGLHYGAVDIDKKENIALAKQFGVLAEGIPNVKLINAGEGAAPLPVMTGEVLDADALVQQLRSALDTAGAKLDASGHYVGSWRVEL